MTPEFEKWWKVNTLRTFRLTKEDGWLVWQASAREQAERILEVAKRTPFQWPQSAQMVVAMLEREAGTPQEKK